MQPLLSSHRPSPEMFVSCPPRVMLSNGLRVGLHHGLSSTPPSSHHHSDATSQRCTPPSSAFTSPATMPPSAAPTHHHCDYTVDQTRRPRSTSPVVTSSPEVSVDYPHQLLANSVESQLVIDPLSGCGAVTMATAVEAWRALNAVHQSAAVAAALAGYGPPSGPPPPCHDPMTLQPFGFHQYNTSYGGIDVRRKNATRESTSTLKAWLYEHIKNPYPTKGEKIMLAIVTRMTLTQVSTWFANARRRLKKENKMQWSPRNRTGEDDDEEDDEGLLLDDNISVDERRSRLRVGNEDCDDEDDDVIVDDGDSEHIMQVNRLQSPVTSQCRQHTPLTACGQPTTMTSPSMNIPAPEIQQQQHPPPEVKPRIWSLADIATSGINSSSSSSSSGALLSSCPKVPLGALWAASSLTSWANNITGCTAAPPLPATTAAFFPNSGLFQVGGRFLHPVSTAVDDTKNQFTPPPRTGNAAAALGVAVDSLLQQHFLSPERRQHMLLQLNGLVPAYGDLDRR